MSGLYQDPYWPRASAWLAGETLPNAKGRLSVLGAPVARSSITPGRCDLAPAAIRAALERFSTADLHAGKDVRSVAVRDRGDLPIAGMDAEQSFGPIRDAVSREMSGTTAVVLLGGDNTITRGGVHGLGLPLQRCGLITLDAHLDLRHLDDGLNNGNPVRALVAEGLPGDQIVQIGLQSFANSPAYALLAREFGIQTLTVEDVQEYGIAKVMANALADLGHRVDRLYVDVDLDVLDRAFAPAAPGSRPGGLSPWEIRLAAQMCGAHHKVHVIDFVEIDPTKDIADCTVMAAASCLLAFASGVAQRW